MRKITHILLLDHRLVYLPFKTSENVLIAA